MQSALGTSEEEVVEQAPVASERLRAHAAKAGLQIPRAQLGHVAGRRAREQVARGGHSHLSHASPPPAPGHPPGARPGKGLQRIGRPQHGELVRVSRAHQQGGGTDEHLALDASAEVHAEKRERGIWDRVDQRAHEVAALV